MKRLLSILVAATIIISCNNDKKTKTETKTEKSTDTTISKPEVKTPGNTMDNNNPGTEETGWKKSEENQFMSDCEKSATPKVGAARANEYCNCMLDKIKKDYKTYQQADRELANDDSAMSKLANECNAGH